MMFQIDTIDKVRDCLQGLKAIIFDLDDTLYSEKEYVKSGYRKIAEHFNIPGLEDEMWAVFESGGKAIDEALKAHGLAEKKEEALRIYRYQEPGIQLYDGVEDMLHNLKSSGYKLGIITDGRPEGQRAKIKALRLNEFFDCIIITDELGGEEYRKPNKAAFVKMQKTLRIPYERMCYAGDNIKKDFIAPEQLGMKCIWFKNSDGICGVNNLGDWKLYAIKKKFLL